jgi:hypothetical protein
MAITATFGVLFVPSKLIVANDITATAHNIITHGLLFRTGIVSSLICQITFIFLVLTLYRLFKEASQKHALLMLTLVLVSVPIAFLNMLNYVAAVVLLNDQNLLPAFTPSQIHALAMVFLDLHQNGTIIVQIFWGLWLFPFGVLIFKTDFIPKIFGILLIVAGLSYLSHSFTFLLSPHFGNIISQYTAAPEAIGELSIVLWLLFKGVNSPKTTTANS